MSKPRSTAPKRDAELMATPMPFMVSAITLPAKPSTPVTWKELQDSYRNADLTPTQLLDAVTAGRSFTARHEPEVKKREHWHSAQYVVLDLEKHERASLTALKANPFYTTYGTFAYTTYSHQEEEPRSRAVFLLHEPITTVARWQHLAKAVVAMFQPECDAASADVSRAFLGNADGEVHINGKFLPPDVVAMLAYSQAALEAQEAAHTARLREWLAHREPVLETPVTGMDGDERNLRKFERWLDELKAAPEGERSRKLNRLAFLAGKHLVQTKVMSRRDTENALLRAAVYTGLTEREARATIHQAVDKGIRATL